jgi:hypothetical protein
VFESSEGSYVQWGVLMLIVAALAACSEGLVAGFMRACFLLLFHFFVINVTAVLN